MRDARRTAPDRHARSLRATALVALVFAGCATLGNDAGQPLVPSRFQTRSGPFAVFTPSAIAPDAPAIRCLQALERDVETNLGLHAPTDSPPVEIYILKDREAFTHFLTFYYPELPPRRAFFLAQGPRRVVYAFHNDRLEEDLRHEATHALLHLVVGDLPLWLDEGLAEYFEGPEDRQGLNVEHMARLPTDLQNGWRPDLPRLESLVNVRQMTPRDYRESWAWVHYLLNGSPSGKAALLDYLFEIHADVGQTTPLSERLAKLETGQDQRMLTHLERVRSSPTPLAPVATPRRSESTILLQNTPLDTPTRLQPRRGLFHHLLNALGLTREP